MQAMVSHMLERRYESGMLQSMLWVIWYPLAYWLISAMTTVVGLPLALTPRRERTTWVSPDRGLR
jgi:biofilm PGA synthesis N-glycosyltransferase PgaC